jgi:branched-chain amino acid transport system ATP-binding protein
MTSPLLELDSVTKRFGRVVIAEDLSLAIGAGDTVGIVGPNGAGKTSLFGLISGDLAPDGGEVRLGGRPSPGWTRRPGAGSVSAAPTRCRGRSPI